eukprot:3010488-Amphidinium_carterae.1
MERVGLELSGSGEGGSAKDDDRVVEANLMCERMGAFATNIAIRRLRSLADEGGYPRRFVQILGAEGERILREFREVVELYESLSGKQGRFLEKVKQRSPLRLKKVQQMRLLCEASDWQVSETLKAVVRKDYACITQTKIVEDGFNHARYVEASKNNRRSITSDHAYAAVIRSD